MGVGSREQLAGWIHNEKFPMPRWRGYIKRQVQERIRKFAVAQEALVSALESVFLLTTLAQCESAERGTGGGYGGEGWKGSEGVSGFGGFSHMVFSHCFQGCFQGCFRRFHGIFLGV